MAKILLVDDEDSLRGLIGRGLSNDGHTVVQATDGAEALSVIESHGESFDLLLSDIQMPVMDGIALALAAARERPDMPILLMTGYAQQRERASELDAIVREVIAKPFTMATLRQSIAVALAPRG